MSMSVRSTKQLVAEMEQYWTTTDREGRGLTSSERADVTTLLEQIKSQKSIEDIGRQLGPALPSVMGPRRRAVVRRLSVARRGVRRQRRLQGCEDFGRARPELDDRRDRGSAVREG